MLEHVWCDNSTTTVWNVKVRLGCEINTGLQFLQLGSMRGVICRCGKRIAPHREAVMDMQLQVE